MDYLQANIDLWQARREDQVASAQRQWASEPTWGEFSVPEAEAGVLPADLAEARAVELGCGTGYVSAWLARRGARPVAVDPTPGQLRIVQECQEQFDLRFPIVCGGPSSACIAASGPTTRRSSSTSATAIGSV